MTDLLDDLRLSDPARGTLPDDPAAARMDAALLAALADEPPQPSPPARNRTGRRRRPRAAMAAATAAFAGALVLTLFGSDGGRVRPASASVVLQELAHADAASPAESGRYAYRRTIDYTTHMRPRPGGSGHFAVVLPHEREEWIDARGDGVISERILEDQARFPTPRDRELYERTPRLPLEVRARRMTVRDVRVAGIAVADIQALPADPAALRRAIAQGMRRAGFKADNAVVAGATQLLSSPVSAPDLRAAIFALLRREPGARVAGDVRDALGRSGVAVTFDSPAWKTTLLFDRADGALLATRSVGKQELPGRELENWSVVAETGRRDSAPADPSPR